MCVSNLSTTTHMSSLSLFLSLPAIDWGLFSLSPVPVCLCVTCVLPMDCEL